MDFSDPSLMLNGDFSDTSLMLNEANIPHFFSCEVPSQTSLTRLNAPHEEIFHFGTFYGIPCSCRSDTQFFLPLIRKLPLQRAHSLGESVTAQ